MVEDLINGNTKLPSPPANFTKDVSNLIREIEIIARVNKYFKNAPRKSILDEWFFKKQELFEIQAIGIYDDTNGSNTQCYDIEQGIKILKSNLNASNIYAFCIFSPHGHRIGKHVNNRNSKISADEVYMLGWQMVHLLEAVHSIGYVFNAMQFDKMIFTENTKSINNKHVDLTYRETTISFNDYSLATPYIDFKTKKHLEQTNIG